MSVSVEYNVEVDTVVEVVDWVEVSVDVVDEDDTVDVEDDTVDVEDDKVDVEDDKVDVEDDTVDKVIGIVVHPGPSFISCEEVWEPQRHKLNKELHPQLPWQSAPHVYW